MPKRFHFVPHLHERLTYQIPSCSSFSAGQAFLSAFFSQQLYRWLFLTLSFNPSCCFVFVLFLSPCSTSSFQSQLTLEAYSIHTVVVILFVLQGTCFKVFWFCARKCISCPASHSLKSFKANVFMNWHTLGTKDFWHYRFLYWSTAMLPSAAKLLVSNWMLQSKIVFYVGKHYLAVLL